MNTKIIKMIIFVRRNSDIQNSQTHSSKQIPLKKVPKLINFYIEQNFIQHMIKWQLQIKWSLSIQKKQMIEQQIQIQQAWSMQKNENYL